MKEEDHGIGPVLAADRYELLLAVDLNISLLFDSLERIDRAGEPGDVPCSNEINGDADHDEHRDRDHDLNDTESDLNALPAVRLYACILSVLHMDPDVPDAHYD